ncbi:gliding motility-associated protein GldE [Flavobacterium sp.]|uniref:gliding motility-associated protein GldE n=1 Tax=Flavobacterium sp. TaxID=239 RepID=UPI0035B1ADE5
MDPDPSYSFFGILDTQATLGWITIFLLLFLSALISAAEVALFSLSPNDVAKLSNENPKKGKLLDKILQKPKKLLATLLLANNFLNIGVVIIFSIVGSSLFENIQSPVIKFVFEVVLVTFLILLFGEVLPKIYASRNSLKFSAFIIVPLSFLDKLLSPVSIPMRNISNILHNKLGNQKSNISVNQLSQALELTSPEDTTTDEHKILEGIVSFGNTDTKQVMSPRIDVFALDIDETFSEIYPKIVDKGYSRIPVFKDNIDHIVGVLFVKDLIPHIHKKEFEWDKLIRTPFFVPENKKLDDLLKDFQTMKSHIAVVVDEYGGTSGIVTLEDIIEEIVGDISDEFDDENINFSQIDEKNFIFEGKINLKDFYKITGLDEEPFEAKKGEAETLAGFILENLGHFPKKGQKIHFSSTFFVIEVVDKRRIKQIKVTLE